MTLLDPAFCGHTAAQKRATIARCRTSVCETFSPEVVAIAAADVAV
jgi:hypothetical protein